MDKDTPGLSQADREVLVVATSAANGCLYCVVAHGALVRIRARDRYLADQVAVDWRKAPLSPRLRAVVEVGVELAVDPVRVTAAHRSEEHTSELQSRQYLVCRLLLEKKKKKHKIF